MIIVKNRELLIPNNERYIGTTYDDNSTVRTFRISRFNEDGMDKSQLDFYVIINYDDGTDPDAVGVIKSVSDDYIVLEWDVGEDITDHSGCLYLWVRGFDHTGTVRWSSFPGVFYIETSGTEPSDLSELEERISEEDKRIRLAKLYKSQPMTAATAAEMINREQIYVYVGDEEGYQYGHWYFWDGSAWVPGGVYNSNALQTDKALMAEDVAADAKAVGDKLNWYVTPEEFGAVGDGVTDDTQAIHAAINSGLTVIGKGTYLVGTGIERQSVFTIDHPMRLVGSFIDNRKPLTTNNLKETGLFVLASDNVSIDINVVGNNTLPVDSAETSNNLRNVGGYCVSVTTAGNIKDCNINICCENINGIGHGAILRNSKINVIAKHSAYPSACNCMIGCDVTVKGEDIHRIFWGAADASFIKCYGKNYVSTGNSTHFLFCDYMDASGKNHLAEGTNVFISDLGTTESMGDTAYFGINLQGPSNAALIDAEVWISGDMTNAPAGEHSFSIGDVGTVNGKLTIHDSLVTDGTQSDRMYNDINDFTVYSCKNVKNLITPKTRNESAIIKIYSALLVVISNFSGKAYCYDCITVTTYTPDTVTGIIYVVNAVSVADFSAATLKRSPVSDDNRFILVNQKAQNTQRISGSGVAFGTSSGKAWISVPLPFVAKDTSYSVSIVLIGIKDVVSGTSGANYTSVIEKTINNIKLEYNNPASTQITDGNTRWCTYVIEIVFA